MLPPRSGQPVPYHVDRARQQNRQCRYCGGLVKPPRRTFCSAECVHEWCIRSDPNYARTLLYKRDEGVCSACGLDTEALETQASRERHRIAKVPVDKKNTWLERFRRADVVILEVQGVNREVPTTRSLWEADHIVPVSEGGGSCALDNYRTLCLWCHRAETKKLRKRLSEARKALTTSR